MMNKNSMAETEQQEPLPKWKLLNNSQLFKRALHSGVVIDKKTLAFWGGVSPPEDSLKRTMFENGGELALFDTQQLCSIRPDTRGNSTGDVPRAGRRNGHRMVLDYEGVYMYLIGGIPNDGTFRMDVRTTKWEKLTSLNINLTHCSVAALSGFIYIFGGKEDPRKPYGSDKLLRFNTTTLKLEHVKSLSVKQPKARSAACMESINDRFLVLFGGDYSITSCCDDLWLFDTEKMEWHCIQSSNPKPIGMGLLGWGKYESDTDEEGEKEKALLFYGGLTISGKILSDLWCLDLHNLQWRIIKTGSKNMKPISNHVNLVAGSTLYVYGGVDTVGSSPNILDSLYSIDFGYAMNGIERKTCSWACRTCGSYTKNMCSQCKVVPFCNKICQLAGTSKHGAECARLCGQDEISIQFNEQKAHFQMLIKMNEEKNSVIVKNEKRIEELENMYRMTVQCLKEKEEMIEFSHSNQQKLNENLQKKENEIKHYKEKLSNLSNDNLKKQKLQEKINILTQDRENLSRSFTKNEIKTRELQQQVETLKKSLCVSKETSSHKMKELQDEVEKNRLEIQVQNDLFNKTRNDLVIMKEKLEAMSENQECPICMDRERNCACQPCGHVFCEHCLVSQKTCPICRVSIKSKVKLFLN